MILKFFLVSLPYLYSNFEAVNKAYDAAWSFAAGTPAHAVRQSNLLESERGHSVVFRLYSYAVN